MTRPNKDFAPPTIEEILEFMRVVVLLPEERRDVVRKILSSAGDRSPADFTPPARYAPFQN